MTTLLFPGRHLLNTTYQENYLRSLAVKKLDTLSWHQHKTPNTAGPVHQIIFAITSSNQANSRYNPIPFHVRAIGVDRLARQLKQTLGLKYRIIGIPHYAPTSRFAEHVLQEIEEQTEGGLFLTPENSVVLCSTESVISLYQDLGFAVLTAELNDPTQPDTPIDLLQKFVAMGENWTADSELHQALSQSTIELWQDFPDVPRRILRLWRDPLLNDQGSLTDSRDYASYAYLMGNSDIITLKYQDIQPAIIPGKIVDEGCGDGALLVPIARDFPDSDLIGIEITGEFIARGKERQRAGEFGGTFVHFHQRNITQPIFEPNSIDTTICNSTVHELWSYGEQARTVSDYFALKYKQTRKGGRLLIRDVVGPENKEQEVYLWLNDQDGRNDNIFAQFNDRKALMAHLNSLSTYGRFLRFTRDFLSEMRSTGQRGPETAVQYREETIEDQRYIVLSLKDAVEFMTKKDYTNNWYSEMNEEFAFWDFEKWKGALKTAGFHIIENPNHPQSGSRVYVNPWIVKNRWQGKVKLFQRFNGRLKEFAFPITNIVLVGEK
jgi:2-polyprenyl-3-methyl-5-hydroxy-6-metoxy-1,4-benzoquinol methylase